MADSKSGTSTRASERVDQASGSKSSGGTKSANRKLAASRSGTSTTRSASNASRTSSNGTKRSFEQRCEAHVQRQLQNG